MIAFSCSSHSASRRMSKVSLERKEAERYFYACDILNFLNKDCNPYAPDSNKVISDSVFVNGWALVKDRLMNEDIAVHYSSSPFAGERGKVIFNNRAYDFDSLISGVKNQDHINSLYRNKFSVVETKKNKYYYLYYGITNVYIGGSYSYLLILDRNKKIIFRKCVKLCFDNEFLSLKNDSLYIHYFSPFNSFARTGDTLINYNVSSQKISKYWVLDAIDSTKYGMYKFRQKQ